MSTCKQNNTTDQVDPLQSKYNINRNDGHIKKRIQKHKRVVVSAEGMIEEMNA